MAAMIYASRMDSELGGNIHLTIELLSQTHRQEAFTHRPKHSHTERYSYTVVNLKKKSRILHFTILENKLTTVQWLLSVRMGFTITTVILSSVALQPL